MTPDECFLKALAHLRAEEYRRAWVSLRRALAGYEAVDGSGRQRARCHHALGSAYLYLDRCEVAVSAFSESLALLEGVDDSELDRAHGLLFLGIALAEAGRASEAADRVLVGQCPVPAARRSASGCRLPDPAGDDRSPRRA